MPNYNSTNPPFFLAHSDIGTAFNAENPAVGQASQQFAMPVYEGFPEQGRAITWQTSFATAPTAVNIVLQAASQDVEAQYQTIDTSTALAGERRSLTGVRALFLRVKLVSITGGSGITVLLLV